MEGVQTNLSEAMNTRFKLVLFSVISKCYIKRLVTE